MRRFWYCSAHRLLDLELCRGPSLPCSKPLTVTPKVLSSSGARCCRVLDPADVAPPQQHDTNTARCCCESSKARPVIPKLVSVLVPTNCCRRASSSRSGNASAVTRPVSTGCSDAFLMAPPSRVVSAASTQCASQAVDTTSANTGAKRARGRESSPCVASSDQSAHRTSRAAGAKERKTTGKRDTHRKTLRKDLATRRCSRRLGVAIKNGRRSRENKGP